VAPAWRTGIETGVFMALLLWVVLTPMQNAPVIVIPATLVLYSLACGTLAGLRLRMADEGWRVGLVRETLLSLPLVIVLMGIGYGMLRLGNIFTMTIGNTQTSGDALMDSFFHSPAVTLAIFFFIPAFMGLRVLSRIWRWWDRLRKKHFLWALTHSQLTVVVLIGLLVVLMGLAAIVYTAIAELNQISSLPKIPSYSVFMQVIIWLLLLAFASLVLTAMAIVFLFPPAFVFSYLVGRGLTRRVETLAQAAARLQDGDFDARVPVEGEDELAQLQVDFNRMAADLQQRTLQLEARTHELQVERDRTAGLLTAHRELTATVSHELRTPVATARAFVDGLLQDRPDESPETKKHDLEILSGEIDRLERLIDDLFTLSRVEIDRLSLSIKPVNVAGLLRGLKAAAEKPAWEQRRVEVLLGDLSQELTVQADAARLEQIIRNLIQNSLRHTPPGGYVLLSAEPAGNEVEIRVEDSGEGIALEDIPHIWDRFYRGVHSGNIDGDDVTNVVRQVGEGSGLGLALVKELTEAMGGTVGVKSSLGEGSTFSIRLPVQAACDTIAT
jgi:signal transduction histidine kinase